MKKKKLLECGIELNYCFVDVHDNPSHNRTWVYVVKGSNCMLGPVYFSSFKRAVDFCSCYPDCTFIISKNAFYSSSLD